MSNIVDLDSRRPPPAPEPHFVAVAMCCSCMHRWIATITGSTSLFKLECPSCHDMDSFASVLPNEYLNE